MKEKILFLVFLCALASGIAFATAGGEGERAVVDEGPQYGGTVTIWMRESANDPPSPDIMDGNNSANFWLGPGQERPVMGDFETYGPRGTGEYGFQLEAFIPENFLTGVLLEDWEINTDRMVWKVRPGIMWHGDKPHIMESRELTAEDMVADLLVYAEAPGGRNFKKRAGDIYATDRYTLIIETPVFDLSTFYLITYEDRAYFTPPEMRDAPNGGAKNWENQIGTGPWMLTEYVPGSHLRYERNPDYWGTTTIDGTEYQLPFIDELVYPIIPDEATQIAALRTGNIDFMYPVQSRHWSDLAETAPEIESSKVPAGRGTVIALNTTDAPVNDVAVRRALMVGTDLRAFHDLHGDVGVLPLHWYPKAPGDPSTYTPLEELPEDVRVLYEYDPELAKEMLAEAGYPNGFELTYTTLSQPASMVDRASLLADMWGDIGVVVNIETVDRPTWSRIAITERGTFEDSIIDFPSTASPFEVVWRGASDGRNNIFNWSNDRFDALAVQIMGELDPVRRGEMIKEAGLIALREASNIPTDPTPTGHFWWPWIRNYFGERNVQDNNFEPVLARAWLDEEMKADMGF